MRSSAAPSSIGFLRVPPHEVEAYLACGWTITSEPTCSGVLMAPPNFNTKKRPASVAASGSGIRENDDRDTHSLRRMQAR
jgi:hypothetical protein